MDYRSFHKLFDESDLERYTKLSLAQSRHFNWAVASALKSHFYNIKLEAFEEAEEQADD